MYRVFIVEDDPIIARTVRQGLLQWGYDVRCAEDFSRVTQEFAAFDPQLVLLDVSLPFFNGYHWCGEIRRLSKVPVMFLSSAADNLNIVMAMNMGGDDFIPKPFDLQVLVAKVQALLRRTYDFSAPAHLIACGDGSLNLESGQLTYAGATVELTRNEFRVLHLLMENKGAIISRQELMMELWQSDAFIDDNTLTVNVNRLRKSLASIGVPDGFLATRRGQGYLV